MTTTTTPRTLASTATPTTTTPPTTTTTTFHGLAYDAFDALATAEFWAAALRLEVAPGATSQHAELLDGPASGAPRLTFRQVADPRVLRTPLHLQLSTTDLDAEASRLLALGARRVGGLVAAGRRSVTLADPEGNAFDLVALAPVRRAA